MRGWFAIGVWHGKNEENIGTLIRSARPFARETITRYGEIPEEVL